jgi:hypothetical protein
MFSLEPTNLGQPSQADRPALAVLQPYLASSSPLPGDYDGSGIVDAADYVVWRDSPEQTGAGLAADGNGNGQIDPGDYEIWKLHFGRTAAETSFVSAIVPEPSTSMLLVVALAGIRCRRPARFHVRFAGNPLGRGYSHTLILTAY